VTCLEKKNLKAIYTEYGVEVQKQLAEVVNAPRKKIIILAGPTAVGKSSFGMYLAKVLSGEIISADSMQVYRGMDIGTAKPTIKDQQEIAHHLIDVCDVKDPFNVVDFYREALQSCRSILARNKTPIVVGGSGFYIHTLLYGPPQGPPACPKIRTLLENELELHGSELLYDRLEKFDPIYAATITKNDKHKIVRALEIIALTGNKVSDHSWNKSRKSYEFDIRCWFLHRPRDLLYKRIEDRCDQMLQAGFLAEVALLKGNGIEANSSAAQAIGYRQALEFFLTDQSAVEYAKFVTAFKQASRQYAKRQFTWFRKEPDFRWLDLDLHDDEVAREMVIQDYKHL